jgi:hypothetical protein
MATRDWTNDPVSDEQIKYIHDLVTSKDLSSLTEAQQKWLANFDKSVFDGTVTKGQAHRVIDKLKTLEDVFPF